MNRTLPTRADQQRKRNTAVTTAMVAQDLPRVMWLDQDACDNHGHCCKGTTFR